MYMKEYSYTVEERNERNSQFSPKILGGFNYANQDKQDGDSTPLSSPQDQNNRQPGYKRATATAFTYKPPESTANNISTRPLSTYRSAMNTPTSLSNNKSSTLPSSRLKESTSAYSWSSTTQDKQEDRVKSEKREERQFAQLINTKEETPKQSASTDKMNALFGSGKSKSSSKISTTESKPSAPKSSIFSSFLKSNDEKLEKKKQLSQSSSNVLEQKKTSSASSLINRYNNLTSSPKVIGSSTGQIRTPQQPVKQTKLDSDSEESSSENSMDEYASEEPMKTDEPFNNKFSSLPRTQQQQNNYLNSNKQRYEPQPTVRTSLTIQPTYADTFNSSSKLSKPPVPAKPIGALTNKVAPYESKFAKPSIQSPIASRTSALLSQNNMLKEDFLKDKPQVSINSQSQSQSTPKSSSLSYNQPTSPYLTNSSPKTQTFSERPNSMSYPYNNAVVTTTTVPHVHQQQPRITHLSKKRTVKKADGSIDEDEISYNEPSTKPQTFISTATFTPSKPLIVGVHPALSQELNQPNRSPLNSIKTRTPNAFNNQSLTKLVLY